VRECKFAAKDARFSEGIRNRRAGPGHAVGGTRCICIAHDSTRVSRFRDTESHDTESGADERSQYTGDNPRYEVAEYDGYVYVGAATCSCSE
jgi:hypothetical protein